MSVSRRMSLAGSVAEVMLTPVNTRLMTLAVDMLDIRPDHRVLAVGAGRGEVLQLLVERAWAGRVTALEPIGALWELAQRRNAASIAVGAIDLLPDDASHLSWPEAAFDRACAINSLYFWPSLEDGFAEACRALKPGGRFVVALRARDDGGQLTWRSTTGRRGIDEIEAALAEAGFTRIERATQPIGLAVAVVIAADAPPHRPSA